MTNRTRCIRAKGESALAALAEITGGDAVATAKRGRKIGGVLIARHPRRLLNAVAFKQITARQFKTAVTQIVKYRAAIRLAEFTAQAARAHRRLSSQMCKRELLFR